MKILVVNLEKDVARREHMAAQMAAADLPFQWLCGVHGASLSETELATHYSHGAAKWHSSRALTPSEIGCALSHIKAYRTIVQQGWPRALILEDDVVVPWSLGEILAEIESHMPVDEPRVCLLSEAEQLFDGTRKPLLGGRFSIAPFKSGYHTSSYVVTRAAAKALSDELYPVSQVADCWSRLRRSGVVKICSVVPGLVEQDRPQFGSSTSDEINSMFGKQAAAMAIYKVRRVRSLIFEGASIAARRILPTVRRSRAGAHAADALLD